ncbi:serine phosphatase RsbU, regulator of sigma subunit [Synechococcus sp. PCC 7502]|uniref:SpoIIE family protein phosphatase n=1 Tax=Synechococcus sp. PCC 7502 TaxID=1173263 RepID=UPI00029FCD38|nr:SpoIIE family protein phosphatase [Synechococcus sp. PCC 7502]AFY74585.1 serine phosphatase RsbU, regulator of sigma subunit [Synechococcus sp. PCC 7502]
MSQILIIDDDPTTRLILSKALKTEGYKVDVADNGELGLEKAQQLKPSLIICDWVMPLMDGLEVCRHVKSIKSLANTYFILLTSRDGVEDIVKGLENGADDFLPKPIRKDEIKARVRAGLRLHKANKDLEFQKSRLEAEQAQAAEYVRSLLPKKLEGIVSIDSYFKPSTKLGGDSFDFYWLDADHLIVYLLDVSGHGVGAALLSVSVLNLLRTKGLQSVTVAEAVDLTNPSQVLKTLNEYFQMSKYNDLYFTIWYGVYNKNSQELTYSSAGHPPAVLLSPPNPDQSKSLKTSGLPIGIIPGTSYQNATCQIESNSKLYIFSDGVYEITDKDNRVGTFVDFLEFLTALNKTINKTLDETSGLREIIAQIIAIAKFGDEFEDDFSLLEVIFN